MQISQPNPTAVQVPVSTSVVRGAQAAASTGATSATTGTTATAASDTASRPTPDSLVARLDAYGAGLTSRIGQALAGAAPGDEAAYKDSLGRFEQSLGRIRAGIEDGSLRGEDLANAVSSSVRMVRVDLESLSAPPSDSEAESAGADATASAAAPTAASDPSAPAGSVAAAGTSQGRFQSIVAGISQRLAGLQSADSANGDSSRLSELAAAEKAFTSAASRMETAFFENGDFDRGTFYGLFSASVGRLQQNVSELSSGTQKTDATLYDPKRGTESLSDGLRKVRFDRTV